MGTVRYAIGDATLVRVPYADVLVDAPVVGLTPAQVETATWAAPTWAEDGQVRVGAAVWIIESEGRRIVVDPAQAADPILREGPDAVTHQEAVAAVLATAGYMRESIDTVIATHIDGIGMIAWRTDDGWAPFFPHADFLVSRRECEALLDEDGFYQPSGRHAFRALHAQGAVTGVDDEHSVTTDVSLRWTGAHAPGHQVVNITSGGEVATMIGHLALSPLHCGLGAPGPHIDAPGAVAALRELADGRLLVGPLWPAPGAVRWTGADVQTASP